MFLAALVLESFCKFDRNSSPVFTFALYVVTLRDISSHCCLCLCLFVCLCLGHCQHQKIYGLYGLKCHTAEIKVGCHTRTRNHEAWTTSQFNFSPLFSLSSAQFTLSGLLLSLTEGKLWIHWQPIFLWTPFIFCFSQDSVFQSKYGNEPKKESISTLLTIEKEFNK